jgi:hypothetical protein
MQRVARAYTGMLVSRAVFAAVNTAHVCGYNTTCVLCHTGIQRVLAAAAAFCRMLREEPTVDETRKCLGTRGVHRNRADNYNEILASK